MKTKPAGINYRYTKVSRERVVRLSERLTEQQGRRVSFMKVMDMALEALERELDREDRKKAKGPGE